jgi:hypothetical protein
MIANRYREQIESWTGGTDLSTVRDSSVLSADLPAVIRLCTRLWSAGIPFSGEVTVA